MLQLRRLVSLLLCFGLLCAQAGMARADDALLWQRNGFAIASNGTETYLLVFENNAWSLHTARRMLAGEPPLYALPEGTLPYGLLYADADSVWYARYSATLHVQHEGERHTALEFVRYALAAGEESVIVPDANPDALFPLDGQRLAFLPWDDECALASIDFTTGKDTLILETGAQILWDVAQEEEVLYLLLITPDTEEESLYRIVDGGVEKLAEPVPTPSVSWLQGGYRVYTDTNGVFYAAPLTDPSRSHALVKAGEQTDVYYFDDNRYVCEVGKDHSATLYRLPLSDKEEIRTLEYDALGKTFVRGGNNEEMVTLDRHGRLLSITQGFTGLEQIAQLNASTLFAKGVWLWALPFPEYVVLLGYAESVNADSAPSLPPDMVRVVRRGEGM